MKKILLGLLAVSAVAFAAEGDVTPASKFTTYFKVGMEVAPTYTSVSDPLAGVLSNGQSESIGFALDGQVTYKIGSKFEAGLGLAYQKHAKQKVYEQVVDSYREWDGDIENVEVDHQQVYYNSIPIYAIGKFNFKTSSVGITPYIFADFGYSINTIANNAQASEDLTHTRTLQSVDNQKVANGLYYGAGAGIDYYDFILEASYQVNTAKYTYTYNYTDSYGERVTGTAKTASLDYSRAQISLGYKFSL
ncbi:MAG: hypothetical protein ACRCSK_01365 [Fusobacteriaceae bacterium]